jgi:hypothetical protein
MARKTVTFTTPDHPGDPREFHLEEKQAELFAADIRAKGGTATVGPLNMNESLKSTLRRAGVNPTGIR